MSVNKDEQNARIIPDMSTRHMHIWSNDSGAPNEDIVQNHLT